jgi:hypothetical protein
MEQTTEQMTAYPLAKIKAMQEKTDANIKEMFASQERAVTKMDAWLAEMMDCRKETTACQEETAVSPEKIEANPEEMKPEAEHEKVPKKKAAAKPVRALKKRRNGRHLAAGRHGKSKEQIQGNGGCRKK